MWKMASIKKTNKDIAESLIKTTSSGKKKDVKNLTPQGSKNKDFSQFQTPSATITAVGSSYVISPLQNREFSLENTETLSDLIKKRGTTNLSTKDLIIMLNQEKNHNDVEKEADPPSVVEIKKKRASQPNSQPPL